MQQSGYNEQKLLTLKQACEIFNCRPNTLRAWDEKATSLQFASAHEEIDAIKREDVMKLLARKQ
jgi:hypothetical protein